MRYLTLTSIIATIFISGCIHIAHNSTTKKSHSKSKLTSLSNEGVVCAYRSQPNELTVKFYPLSSSCISSSAIDWKLVGFDSTIKNNALNIESYALFKRNNSKINTTDCAGAKKIVKKIATPTKSTTLYWGNQKVVNINSNKRVVCYKKVGNSIKKVNLLR